MCFTPSFVCSVQSFSSCVKSRFFIFHLVWLSIMQLRHYLFIGTLHSMLNRLADGDSNLGKSLSSLSSLIQIFSDFILLFFHPSLNHQ